MFEGQVFIQKDLNKNFILRLQTCFWLGSTWDNVPQLLSREHLRLRTVLGSNYGFQFQKVPSHLELETKDKYSLQSREKRRNTPISFKRKRDTEKKVNNAWENLKNV